MQKGKYNSLSSPPIIAETVAELRMLRTCGVDAVGMSTIPEVLVASHCGIRVFAFSLVTNECVIEEEESKYHLVPITKHGSFIWRWFCFRPCFQKI